MKLPSLSTLSHWRPQSITIVALSFLLAVSGPMTTFTSAQSIDLSQITSLKQQIVSEVQNRISSYQKTLNGLSFSADLSAGSSGANGGATVTQSDPSSQCNQSSTSTDAQNSVGALTAVLVPCSVQAQASQYLQGVTSELGNLLTSAQNATSLSGLQSIATNLNNQSGLDQLTQIQASVTQAITSMTGVLSSLQSAFSALQNQVSQLQDCANSGSATATVSTSGASLNCGGVNLSTDDASAITQAQSQLGNISTIITTVASTLLSAVSLILPLALQFASLAGSLGGGGSSGLSNLTSLGNVSSVGDLSSMTGLLGSVSDIGSLTSFLGGGSGGSGGSSASTLESALGVITSLSGALGGSSGSSGGLSSITSIVGLILPFVSILSELATSSSSSNGALSSLTSLASSLGGSSDLTSVLSSVASPVTSLATSALSTLSSGDTGGLTNMVGGFLSGIIAGGTSTSSSSSSTAASSSSSSSNTTSGPIAQVGTAGDFTGSRGASPFIEGKRSGNCTVDYSRYPSAKQFGDQLVDVCNQQLTNITQVTSQTDRIPPIQIMFIPNSYPDDGVTSGNECVSRTLGGGGALAYAQTYEGRVYICGDVYKTSIPGVIVHEMTHLTQEYAGSASGHTGYTAPGWFVEGVADYTRSKLGFNDQGQIYASGNPYGCGSTETYTVGYMCAAALFYYIARQYNLPNIVSMLHSAANQGHYTDSLFEADTGKTLTQLYNECLSVECKGGAQL